MKNYFAWIILTEHHVFSQIERQFSALATNLTGKINIFLSNLGNKMHQEVAVVR